MSFFKKVLGSVGIGAAKIDTILATSTVQPGEDVSGIIKITGGKVEQNINKIDLDILCNYTVEKEVERTNSDGDDTTETVTEVKQHKLTSYKFDEEFVIAPGDSKELPFTITLSAEAPLTVGKSKVWVDTNLDIDMALDKSDKDYIKVVPNQLQQAVFDALQSIGFQLYDADSEGVGKTRFSSLPFIQEFEFKTVSGEFHGDLDELEVVFVANGQRLDVIFEIDRKARGLFGFMSEALGRDESVVRIQIDEDDLDDLEDKIFDLIESNC